MNTLARTSALILAILLGGATLVVDRYEALPESRIWIDGRSTAGSYSCEGSRVVGFGQLAEGSDRSVQVEVAVPVRSFDCGMRQMNADFTSALKAEAHPAISFSLRHVAWSAGSYSSNSWVPISANGDLEVAGETKRVNLRLEGQRQATGLVRIRGSHPLRMTDFGVEPPSGLLGLVRSRDEIVVRFDLRAAPR